jgi:hypothetical protein
MREREREEAQTISNHNTVDTRNPLLVLDKMFVLTCRFGVFARDVSYRPADFGVFALILVSS